MRFASLITAAAFPVMGCASTTPPPVTPPANLTQPCPPLERLAEPADLGDLLQASIQTAVLYQQCAARHDELSAWVKGQ